MGNIMFGDTASDSHYPSSRPTKINFPCDVHNWNQVQSVLLTLRDAAHINEMWSPLLALHRVIMQVEVINIEQTNYWGLVYFYARLARPNEQVRLQDTLRIAAQLALKIDREKPANGLLVSATGTQSKTTLSRNLIASMLGCAFLCIFPDNQEGEGGFQRRLPRANFTELYDRMDQRHTQAEKLKFIMNYFQRVRKGQGQLIGDVTFTRVVLSPSQMYDRKTLMTCNKRLCDVSLDRKGRIEDAGHHCMQVDFANRFLGGGVLHTGSVQEEIRFCTCPELIAGMFFMECMADRDAIQICGYEQFSSYAGYARSLTFNGDFIDQEAAAQPGHIQSCLTAIDAIHYESKSNAQYREEAMLRELNKAFAGFKQDGGSLRPVATGNWGCGAFGGDPQLKSFIQWIAASLAGCPRLIYFSFGQPEVDEFDKLSKSIIDLKMTVSDVTLLMMKYCSLVKSSNWAFWSTPVSFYKHIKDQIKQIEKKKQQQQQQQQHRHHSQHGHHQGSHPTARHQHDGDHGYHHAATHHQRDGYHQGSHPPAHNDW